MHQLSAAGQQIIDDIAHRHGFSVDATSSMLDAVTIGHGSMAQFEHPEFGGQGQWMRGGMTMVSDMFNNQLKGRVDALCIELSNLVASQPDVGRSGSWQAQSQGTEPSSDRHQISPGDRGSEGFDSAGLLVPPTPQMSGDWWPATLGRPNSTGAQNGIRYAYFASVRRLAIDVHGTVTVYDTRDHQIGGFSQQQSAGSTLSFSSQHGPVDVASLPLVSTSGGRPPRTETVAGLRISAEPEGIEAPSGSKQDVLRTIESLADLRAKGILSEKEFSDKKAELLRRI